MSSNNVVKYYVPEFVPQDLPWYERDGLMTWCHEFLRYSDNHFKTTKKINFDIIRTEFAGKKVPDEVLKKYQTFQNQMVSKYSETNQKMSCVVLFEPIDLIFF